MMHPHFAQSLTERLHIAKVSLLRAFQPGKDLHLAPDISQG